MLLVGSTGAGKSSFTMQCAILWALGRAAFGIEPARPLRILIVQAENDDGDIFDEMDGVRQGLELSAEEWQRAVENIRIAQEMNRAGSKFCQYALRPSMEDFKPDIVFIDPAFAFLGGETNNQGHVSEFLRTLINPLIHEFKCAVIINHHTNKPPNAKDAKGGGWTDMQKAYAASGSNEWPNWARAVMVLEEIPKVRGAYHLIAAKRGARLQWREADGETLAFRKAIRHSKQEDQIFWSEMTEEEIADAEIQTATQRGSSERRPGDEDYLGLLDDMPLTQAEWLKLATRTLGIGKSTFNKRLAELKTSGAVVLDGRRYSRAPQAPNPVRAAITRHANEV